MPLRFLVKVAPASIAVLAPTNASTGVGIEVIPFRVHLFPPRLAAPRLGIEVALQAIFVPGKQARVHFALLVKVEPVSIYVLAPTNAFARTRVEVIPLAVRLYPACTPLAVISKITFKPIGIPCY